MSRKLVRVVGLVLMAGTVAGIFSVNYTAGVTLLVALAVFGGALLATRHVKLALIVGGVGACAGVAYLILGPQQPAFLGGGGAGIAQLPMGTSTRGRAYAVSDYLVRVHPSHGEGVLTGLAAPPDAANAETTFIVEEHLTLTPASSDDGPSPIVLDLPARQVASESVGLAARRVNVAPLSVASIERMVPSADLPPNSVINLRFPYQTALRFEVVGLPGGAFTQPLVSSTAPVATPSQVSWSTDDHSADNGFEYYSGPGVFLPLFGAVHNLGSIGQALLIVLTNSVLFVWVKIAEPMLTDLAKGALKRRFPLADPNRAPMPAH